MAHSQDELVAEFLLDVQRLLCVLLDDLEDRTPSTVHPQRPRPTLSAQRPHAARGARIRAARKKMKLTQCELAKRLDVGQSHLWKWEAGMRKPSDANLMRL